MNRTGPGTSLVMSADELAAALAELRRAVGPTRGDVFLVVPDGVPRPSIRRLCALEFPDVPVLSAEEATAVSRTEAPTALGVA
jgi:hypothetical protein